MRKKNSENLTKNEDAKKKKEKKRDFGLRQKKLRESVKKRKRKKDSD